MGLWNSLSLYTHSLTKEMGLLAENCTEAPISQILLSRWFIAFMQVNLEAQTIVITKVVCWAFLLCFVLLLPQAIYTSQPLCHYLIPAFFLLPLLISTLRHIQRTAPRVRFKIFVFIFSLFCASGSAFRYISDLSPYITEKVARVKVNTLFFSFLPLSVI